ncbi:MAG: RNA polymerase sigma factor [Patescibacteria group bacterium]
MENLTDAQLIALYAEGNHKAFDGLINRHSQAIYRFTLKLLGNSDEARDATQEAFIKAWKHIDRFDTSKNFKTWIFSIAKNGAIDKLRKNKSVNFSSLDDEKNIFDANIPDDQLLPNEIFERNENIEIIKNALGSIPFDQKTVILLHNGEEMTFEEISEVLSKPMNTVKSQYRRALISLRKYIESQNAPKP